MSVSHDFLSWKSFPSSLKIENPGPEKWVWHYPIRNLPVVPGKTLTGQVYVKQKDVTEEISGANLYGRNGAPRGLYSFFFFPKGTYDWQLVEGTKVIPSDVTMVDVAFFAGKGITWLDDLKIFQDGVLIYSDDFSKWDPLIGAGVGAPIGGVAGYLLREPLGPMVSEAVGAVVGGALGGGIGLLTGLGIIPVPQIPSLEAAPEGPEAPAQLGKYQITG